MRALGGRTGYGGMDVWTRPHISALTFWLCCLIFMHSPVSPRARCLVPCFEQASAGQPTLPGNIHHTHEVEHMLQDRTGLHLHLLLLLHLRRHQGCRPMPSAFSIVPNDAVLLYLNDASNHRTPQKIHSEGYVNKEKRRASLRWRHSPPPT